VVQLGNHVFVVDCGEGTQHQLRKFKVKFSRVNHIFISHLHGDHYLGLMGIISTFHLNNRKQPLWVYGPKGLDEIITLQLKYAHTLLRFPIHFIQTDPTSKNELLDLPELRISSFPLLHRIPCTGFLFEEKSRPKKLIKEKIRDLGNDVEAIRALASGRDVMDDNGKIKYAVETYCHPGMPPRKYAFCSDTIYHPEIIPYIKDVDLLYHEATFMQAEQLRAQQTFHSTATQAATIARDAGAKQLLLGHFSTRYTDLYPLLWEARQIFEPTLLGEEGNTYMIH
jgi:ribonuclease Z